MKINRNLYLSLSCVACISLYIISCKKDGSSNDNPVEKQEFASVTSASDAEAEGVFNDVFDNVIGVNTEVGIGGTGIFAGTRVPASQGEEILGGARGLDTTHCFTVNIVPLDSGTIFPLRVIIDFGTGCTALDGKTRKGKIITEYSNSLVIPGATATTTFDGYYVNDIKVEGTHTVTNGSTANNRSFTVEVDGKLSRDNGNFSEWNSTKTIAQVSGLGTPWVPADDVFEVTGSANGAVKIGDKLYEWNTKITNPLSKQFGCRYIAKGTIGLYKNSTLVALLDYGQGDCDNKATLTVNGAEAIITLH
jgi:hypothetical protein